MQLILFYLKDAHPSPRTKIVDDKGRPVMPLLIIDWIEIEGAISTAADVG